MSVRASALLALLLVVMPSAACPKTTKGSAKVKVTFVVILASDAEEVVDKRLVNIAREVQKVEPSLTSFQLKSMTVKSLKPNEKFTFATIEDQHTHITVKHGADDENRVSLAVTAPGQGEIAYRSACGKFLPIVTRYYTADNERLILAIRVQPCNE